MTMFLSFCDKLSQPFGYASIPLLVGMQPIGEQFVDDVPVGLCKFCRDIYECCFARRQLRPYGLIEGCNAWLLPCSWQDTYYIDLCFRLAMAYGTHQFADAIDDFMVCVLVQVVGSHEMIIFSA